MMICFFFSSRRRHTRLQGDWSSDVCSSDLRSLRPGIGATRGVPVTMGTPTPRRLYVHDDLSEELARHGEDAPIRQLGRVLFTLLAREPDRVVVLTPAAQIAALIEQGGHRPFGAVVAIGPAGAAVAARGQGRTGWAPGGRRGGAGRAGGAGGGAGPAAPAPRAR